jgi:hypothetical protein
MDIAIFSSRGVLSSLFVCFFFFLGEGCTKKFVISNAHFFMCIIYDIGLYNCID